MVLVKRVQDFFLQFLNQNCLNRSKLGGRGLIWELSFMYRFSLTNANSHQILSIYPVRKFNLVLTSSSAFHFGNKMTSEEKFMLKYLNEMIKYWMTTGILLEGQERTLYLTLLSYTTLQYKISLTDLIGDFNIVNKDRPRRPALLTLNKVTVVRRSRMISVLNYRSANA